MNAEFESDGYTILSDVVSASQLTNLIDGASSLTVCKAGNRNLLEFPWCQHAAKTIRLHPIISSLLPDDAVAIQCIYFEKAKEQNWLVALHRDYMFPVRTKIANPEWTSWSTKQGHHYCRPPLDVLGKLVAVRVHLERNDETNGPLQVVPGSHRSAQDDGIRKMCLVPAAGAVVLRPLLLHGSSKVLRGVRRVLHFVFAPASLPDGAEWAYAV